MVASASAVSRRFDLPLKSLLPGSSGFVDVGGDANPAILEAVLRDEPFPGGEIRLGQISLDASPGDAIRLGTPGAEVNFGGTFRGRGGLAVLDSPESVLAELDLGAELPLPLNAALAPEKTAVRYVLFRAGYEASGSLRGKHPIGVFGSVSFGVSANDRRLYAVIHRIESAAGARGAIGRTISSFVLPGDIDQSSDLAPGTMLLAEVDGSVALNIATGLGYDFSFLREVEMLGLTGDLGLKLDLGLKATLGFKAGGRYLAALDRCSLDDSSRTLRVRLFKLSTNGWDFGLNLSARVAGRTPLPDGADDFVRAVFGLHGKQVVRELRKIEEWTDPSADPSRLVAGLSADEGLRLLERVTGVDPKAAFDVARGKLLKAIDLWESLPERAGAAAARLLDQVAGNEKARTEVVAALSLIAGSDAAATHDQVLRLAGASGFEQTPLGGLLSGIATHGLFALLDDKELPQLAVQLRSVLDGSETSRTIESLQGEIRDALNLQPVLDAARKTDFDALNGWLVGRLSALLDERFEFGKLKQVQDTIHKVIAFRRNVYDKAVQAIERRYDFSLAAAWQKTTAQTALLDAEFDMARPAAQAMLRRLLRDADYDALLMQVVDGVTLHEGMMSHSVERRCSIEVSFPCYKSKETVFNKAVANVQAEEDHGRVLVYGLEADDRVTVSNRFRSQVAATAALTVPATNVRMYGAPRSTWAYSLRIARHGMPAEELRTLLQPFVEQYFAGRFPDGPAAGVDRWVSDLARKIEGRSGDGGGKLGDVLLAADVGLDQGVLAAWLRQRTAGEAREAAKRVSLRLQSRLKHLLPFYFFQDLDRLFQNETAGALLVWAALPPVAGTAGSDDVYWDWMDPGKREEMVRRAETASNLASSMARNRARLLGAGRRRQAGFFDPGEIDDLVEAAGYRQGGLFHSLLFTEATTVDAARAVIFDASDFWRDRRTLASRSIERLADFGAEITRTFHSRLGSVYGSGFLRPLGSMLFLEAARVLEPALEATNPEAILSLTVLRENAGYAVEKYLNDVLPPASAVALEQRLVASAG